MAQTWPPVLQQLLSESNFGMSMGETSIRTDMEVGPAKVRRRFTKPIDNFSASIYLTRDQFQVFYDFYNTTLGGGTLPFEFNHPITQAPTEFRFTDPPKISSIGGGNFTASFSWESLP